MDPHSSFATFTKAHDLSQNASSGNCWTQQRTLQDFPYATTDIQIIKQGILLRPSGSWFKKDSWLPALFVITDTGYLHCFKEAHGVKAGDVRRKEKAKGKKGKSIPATRSEIEKEEAELPAYKLLDKPKTFYR